MTTIRYYIFRLSLIAAAVTAYVKNEPVMAASLSTALATALGYFGLHINATAIIAFAAVTLPTLSYLARMMVTPTASIEPIVAVPAEPVAENQGWRPFDVDVDWEALGNQGWKVRPHVSIPGAIVAEKSDNPS